MVQSKQEKLYITEKSFISTDKKRAFFLRDKIVLKRY